LLLGNSNWCGVI